MDALTFNSVLRLSGHGLHGFYRVVAAPPGHCDCWIAFVASIDDQDHGAVCSPSSTRVGSLTRASRATLAALDEDNDLREVQLENPGVAMRSNELDDTSRKLWEARQMAMAPFFNHDELCKSLEATGGIGPLVRTATERAGCSRASVYRYWLSLCEKGFTAASLIPDFDQCGAPGVSRPMDGRRQKPGCKPLKERLGIPEPFPQRGITEEDLDKMIHFYRSLATARDTMRSLYERVIEAAYVTRYVDGPNGREPVMPPRGTFPNLRQFRHAIETQIHKIERKLRQTTEGHFQRNLRGLRGPIYADVPGPGHTFAIDSTIGDVHLRSSVNLAWIIGRPIVYLTVDFWSTAIVGFYVCLSGPSWATAKLALFSTFSNPQLIAELWGYQYVGALYPAPAMPAMLLCDRGEYLSMAARATGSRLGLNLSFNPAYRPDLKGMVEVLHRIAKDEQYRFVPGAIDARRAELELKSNAKESVLTLRQYVKLLHSIFVQYNLFADRQHLMTTEMIAANVPPSPAGVWRFGFEAGLGYQKKVPSEQLMSELLHEAPMSIRRNGVFVESLRYEGDLATSQRWNETARIDGTSIRPAYMFPGSASRIWTPERDGMHQFNLSPTARATPETTLDEWRDSLMYSRIEVNDRDYRRLCAAATNLVTRRDLIEQAKERVAAAEADYVGQKLTTREARDLERLHGSVPEPQALLECNTANASPACKAESSDDSPTNYEATMNAIFAEMNEEASKA